MAIGRKTGGRQKGSLNRKNAEVQEAAAASGVTPLEYMLQVMRDDKADRLRRDDMAKAAAPYLHPRLSSAEVKSQVEHRYVARIPEKTKSPEQWQQQHAPEATQH